MAAASLLFFIPQLDDSWCRNLNPEAGWPTASNPLFSCGGTIRTYMERGGGFDKLGDLIPDGTAINHTVEKKWQALNALVGRTIEELNPQGKLVVFSQRHILANVNTVQLWSILSRGRYFPVTQIEPATIKDDVGGYMAWLSASPSSSACLVIATTSRDGQFPPAPTYEFIAQALKASGLSEVARFRLPDERQDLVIWRHAAHCS